MGEKLRKLSSVADVHSLEKSSGRSALHKAAFWGHTHILKFLVSDCKIDPNVQDMYGDTAMHDAAKLGHLSCVDALLSSPRTKKKKKVHAGETASDIAAAYEQPEV